MASPSLRKSLVSNGHIELDDGNFIPRESSFMSRRDSLESSAAGSFSVDEIDDQSLRAEANSAMICLEVISGRVLVFLIVLSYLTMFTCMTADILTTRRFGYEDFYMNNSPCPTGGVISSFPIASNTSAYGCTNGVNASSGVNSTSWQGEVLNLENVISVELVLQYTNETLGDKVTNTYVPPEPVDYKLSLWACYQGSGCGNKFADDSASSDNAKDAWHTVLTMGSTSRYFDVQVAGSISLPLITLQFQNQESIPTSGIVKSYYVDVEYFNAYEVSDGIMTSPHLKYSFNVISRPYYRYEIIISSIITLLTIGFTCAFAYLVWKYQNSNWLPEQIWLMIYFFAIVMFQNPLYQVISFLADPSIVAAYTTYVFDRTSQVCFLVMFLLFADSIHYRHSSKKYDLGLFDKIGKKKFRFYAMKVLFGLAYLGVSIALLTFEFPNITKSTDYRSPVLSVSNWPTNVQEDYVILSFFYFSLFIAWVVWWFYRMYSSGVTLNEVPYMQTRYLQLSFRFFTFEAVLVFVYYLVQYGSGVTLFYASVTSPYLSQKTITDEVNTLFRQQTQLFGKSVFLTVYLAILAFVFLPAQVLQDRGPFAALAATTFVIKEKSLGPVRKSREKAIQRMKNGAAGALNNIIVDAKPDLFCVEVAVQSLAIAYEAYYDPPDCSTASGSGPMAILDSMGFSFVASIYDEETEIFGLVARHIETRKIVFSFRGTRNSRHWKTNLDYGQRDFDLQQIPLPHDVDAEDGLDLDGLVPVGKDGGGHDGGLGKPVPNPLTAAIDADDGSRRSREEGSESDDADASIASFHSAQDQDEDFRVNSDSFHSAGEDVHDWIDYDSAEDGDSVDTQSRSSATSMYDRGMRDTILIPVKATARAVQNIATTAAKNTPVLNNLVKEKVHKGFYEAYMGIRERLHAVIRKELKKEPGHIVAAGHSLGGALATIAAVDLATHTMPRVCAYHRHHRQDALRRAEAGTLGQPGAGSPSRSNTETGLGQGQGQGQGRGQGTRKPVDAADKSSSSSAKGKKSTKFRVSLYNFGSPKVGNGPFAALVDKVVPDSFRVKADGDIVTDMPLTGYSHGGTEIVIDSKGYGSIIIDPSFVEKWLRPSKRGISVHFLDKYRAGLEGILRLHDALETMGNLDLGKAQRRPTMESLLDERIVEYRRMVSGRGGDLLLLEEEGDGSEAGGPGEVPVVENTEQPQPRGVDDAEKPKPKFKLPLISYIWSQTYNLLYLRFNREAQQTQMEQATDQANVPVRQASAERLQGRNNY